MLGHNLTLSMGDCLLPTLLRDSEFKKARMDLQVKRVLPIAEPEAKTRRRVAFRSDNPSLTLVL